MKKYLVSLAVILIPLAITAQVTTSLLFNTAQQVLSTAGTGVVTGSSYALPGGAVNSLAWQITHNGSAINIALQASLDGTNWYQVDTSTAASGEIRNYGFNAFKFIRIAQTSRTGGTSTVVTVTAARGYTSTTSTTSPTLSGHLLFNPDNTYDIGSNGALRPRNIYAAGTIFSANNIAATGFYNFNGGARLNNGTQSGHLLTDSTGTSYGALQFGGSTSSFPAIFRSGAQLLVKLADNSANADIIANSFQSGASGVVLASTTFAALGTPGNGNMRFCSDCTFANPCASGGTGAIAMRLNGAWRCD